MRVFFNFHIAAINYESILQQIFPDLRLNTETVSKVIEMHDALVNMKFLTIIINQLLTIIRTKRVTAYINYYFIEQIYYTNHIIPKLS